MDLKYKKAKQGRMSRTRGRSEKRRANPGPIRAD
jgi:hypothetical protein